MQLYSVKKASSIIGCSTNTLYKYLNDGRIKASRGTKIQGRFRIPKSSIEKFLGTKLEDTPVKQAVKTEPEILPTPTPPTLAPKPISKKKTLSLSFIRGLIIFGMLLILVDSLTNHTTSIAVQINRLTFVAIALLLAYQHGGYLRQ